MSSRLLWTMAVALLLAESCLPLMGQESGGGGVTVTGSVQSDVLIPQKDETIGINEVDDWAQTNSYAEVGLQSKFVDAGLRVEYLEHPLPGYERDLQGWGIGSAYVKGHFRNVELTAGSVYDQFGSGFIFRTYEERSLGVDNALIGGRLLYKPVSGVTMKVLSGKQRRYWKLNDSWISGADVEVDLDQWIKPLRQSDSYLSIGASFVNKHEGEEDIMTDALHKLNLPTHVNAFDVRARFQKGNVSLLAEYAGKSQDPSFDNGYIYRRGHVAMLSGSYSKRGVSLLLQVKRSDNMTFRSRRTMTGISSSINHLPAFTMEHTYALPASYPYATNPNGEWAYQAEGAYTFKPKTLFGGRYGTTLKLEFSHVHAIDQQPKTLNGQVAGSDGYHSDFWKWGNQTYYQDLNVQVEKRITKSLRMNLMYMNQLYNMTAIEGEGGMIHADILVGEAKYRISPHLSLRSELQYLFTKQDEGDWAFGLLELSMAPHWMVSISDNYNVGDTHVHYYMGSVAYSTGAHRLQVGYGRTRASYQCSGGVCRFVPASKGLSLSYNYNF